MSGDNIYLTDMVDVLRDAGVAVGENGITRGWQNRARASGGYPSLPLGVFWHHTASKASVDSDLAYCIHFSDAAPVGNLLLDRLGVAWPIAAGASNTAGKGGPVSFSRGTCPENQGNSRCFHIEACNSGIGEPWPQAQIDAFFKISNAMNQRFGNLPTDITTHSRGGGDGYTARKIDPSQASAVLGPWRPRSVNGAGTWSMPDIKSECARRATTSVPKPTPPVQPDSEEDDYMAFIIRNSSTGEVALVYGDRQVVGLAGEDLDAYQDRFGAALPTNPVVWAGFIAKAS